MKKLLLSLLALLVFVSISYAVPTQINVQGILKDSSGNLLSGTKTVTFSIYDVATGNGSSPFPWSESQTVTVKDGIYNVQLGSATTNGIPASLFDGNTRYLGVKVESSDENSPRAVLVTVPYAFRAAVADSVVGGTSTGGDYVRFGTTEVQSTSKTYGLYVNTDKIAGIAIAGSDDSLNGLGVWGRAEGIGGVGVMGRTIAGTGVYGQSNTGKGVSGFAAGSDGVGVHGRGNRYGGSFEANSRPGYGIYAASTNANPGASTYAGYFKNYSNGDTALYSEAAGSGTGIYGVSPLGTGVYGTGRVAGVSGMADPTIGTGVYGGSFVSTGVSGESTAGYGGHFKSVNNVAVYVDSILQLEPRRFSPDNPKNGMIYYDDTSNKIRAYVDGAWVDLH